MIVKNFKYSKYKKFITLIFALYGFIFLSQSCKGTKTLFHLSSEETFNVDEQPLKLLKSGSIGEIWESPEEGFVEKRAVGIHKTRKLEQEKNKQKKVSQQFKNFIEEHKEKNFQKRMIVFKVKKFKKTTTEIEIEDNIEKKVESYFEMPRLYPIPDRDILQLYLGCKSKKELQQSNGYGLEDRGTYISYRDVKKILQQYPKVKNGIKNINQLSYDMGILYGFLNFVAKMDGKDVEFCLGRRSNEDPSYILAMLDFGEANFFDEEDDDDDSIIKKSVYTMSIEPFIPRPTTRSFKFFRNGYLFVAKSVEQESIAEQIINQFLQQAFLQREIIKKVLKMEYSITARPQKRFLPPNQCVIIYNWLKEKGTNLLKLIKRSNYFIPDRRLIKLIKNKLNRFIKSKEEIDFESKPRSQQILFRKLKNALIMESNRAKETFNVTDI